MKNVTYTDKNGNKWDYQIPFLITCTVSGTVKKYTSEEYINGKIDRFGGLDNMRKTYVSRDAKKAAKVLKQLQDAPPVTAPVVVAAPVLTTESTEPVVVTETTPADLAPITETAPIVETPVEQASNIFQEVMQKPEEVVAQPEPLPIAKKDKNGKYRNAKGHLISEANLSNYQVVAA